MPKKTYRTRCSKCLGENVEVVEWTNPNTDEVTAAWSEPFIGDFDYAATAGMTFCFDCDSNTPLETVIAEEFVAESGIADVHSYFRVACHALSEAAYVLLHLDSDTCEAVEEALRSVRQARSSFNPR